MSIPCPMHSQLLSHSHIYSLCHRQSEFPKLRDRWTETRFLAVGSKSTPEVDMFENVKGLRAQGWSSQLKPNFSSYRLKLNL